MTALVGFASSFTVVLAGLRAAGASDQQPPPACWPSAWRAGSPPSGWAGGTGYR
ncbi:hypothetical protein NKG94_33895 [Micromonospora sp. M12]